MAWIQHDEMDVFGFSANLIFATPAAFKLNRYSEIFFGQNQYQTNRETMKKIWALFLFIATASNGFGGLANSAGSVADNPLNHVDSAGELQRQIQIGEQYSQQQQQIALANQRAYNEQLNSLNSLRQQLETLQSADAGGLFRSVHGVTNYIHDVLNGWNYVSGKVIQTLPDGVLVKPDDGTDIFIEGYPFQTVDDQFFGGCMAKNDGVYSFIAVSGGRRTVRKMNYGVTVIPSPETVETEINQVKYEIANHPLVLKAKADAVARIKAAELKKSSQLKVLKLNQEQADKGDPYSLLRMAQRYRDGDGVEKDTVKAKEYFNKAIAAGSSTATAELENLSKTSP